MSELEYVNGPGAGQTWSDLGHYSQAVFLPGSIVKCSGQGGCDDQGNLAGIEWKEQIDKAFENVDRLLQAAGLRGWEDVSASFPLVERIPFFRTSFIFQATDRVTYPAPGLLPPKLPSRHGRPVAIHCRKAQDAHSRTSPPLDLSRRGATRLPGDVG